MVQRSRHGEDSDEELNEVYDTEEMHYDSDGGYYSEELGEYEKEDSVSEDEEVSLSDELCPPHNLYLTVYLKESGTP